MSKTKRLQVLFEEGELESLQQSARNAGVPLSEWVRGALRASQGREATGLIGAKLDAVRRGAKMSIPIGDIGDVLTEIEAGRRRQSE